jgi:hypothetical protein
MLPYVSFSHIIHSSKSPEMQYVEHKLVNNTCPSHHVKHADTHVPYNCSSRAGKQAIIRYSVWLDVSLNRVLFDEFVELSPL